MREVCTVGMRSVPQKACGPQLRRHLPQGSVKVWGQLEDSLAPRGSQRAIACMSAQR